MVFNELINSTDEMRTVFPGRPQAQFQAVSNVLWQGRRIITYISGNALILLGGPNDLLQTIYHDDHSELTAVAIEETSGKIAICSDSKVQLYAPITHDDERPRWAYRATFDPSSNDADIASLSWRSSGELLVGGSSLTLFATNDPYTELWTRPLSSKVKVAEFSPDGNLIASIGWYDRLVKLWRTRSFGDNERFDVAYLSHPAAVTAVKWSKNSHQEDHRSRNVLHTTCSDMVLRVWAPMDSHDLQILQLWAELDMKDCIQPRTPLQDLQQMRRFVFVVDSHTFKALLEAAASFDFKEEREKHHCNHLSELAEKDLEVCVILDDRGNMSAWGLEMVGCKARQPTDVYNLAYTDGFNIQISDNLPPADDFYKLSAFAASLSSGVLDILVHSFDGRLEWFSGTINKLFDPAFQAERIQLQTSWTGHAEIIEKLVRNRSGKALLSRTSGTEGNVWIQGSRRVGAVLTRQSVIDLPPDVMKSCVLREGDYVLLLHTEEISLWDTKGLKAIKITACNYRIDGRPLCLLLLPKSSSQSDRIYAATISATMSGIAWVVHFDHESEGITLEEYASFSLDQADSAEFFLPVDPAGLTERAAEFFDTFADDVAVSISESGTLSTWTATVDATAKQVRWLQTALVETAMYSSSLISGTSIRKAAVIDNTRTILSIWDTRAKLLEFTEQFKSYETIQDLDWTSTPDNQSLLAVGFPHKVLIYVQLRFDYLDARPCWSSVRTVDISTYTTMPIADSIWLDNGDLVIAAGHQLFLYDRQYNISNRTMTEYGLARSETEKHDIFEIASRLNGPLSVLHPQFLSQCILSGKISLVHFILTRLYKSLKFYSVGDELDATLGIPLDDLCLEPDLVLKCANGAFRRSLDASSINEDYDDSNIVVSEEVAALLNEKLSKVQIPQLSGPEQIHLMDIAECVGTVAQHERSIDDHALRYLTFFRQQSLRARHAGKSHFQLPWRDIIWAYHSRSQEILVDLTSRHFGNKMTWQDARDTGLFMWLTDATALKTQFEIIARNEYTKTDEKNPIDCSLYYLALRKKAVLQGLWRMATWNREQRATQRLLANDFKEPRWKTAALKNAYALMGKRRFAYAAAFFLLADRLQDAVGVLSSRLEDMQLAIAVARVYEGDNGPVLRFLLEEKILPQAAGEGDRWMANWALWMLNRKDMALRALIEPLHSLLKVSGSPALQSRLYLTDDPALVVLYRHLRDKSLQTLRCALQLPLIAEWDLVLQSARLYGRMGCDMLALDLVRNWEFLEQKPPLKQVENGDRTAQIDTPDPRKLLRRRSSLVVADLPVLQDTVRSPAMIAKNSPTVLEEPSTASILDSFDF